MGQIDRRSLLLLLLGVSGEGSPSEGMGGITRLQKLIFLLEREGGVQTGKDDFDFSAYKAGPYSSKLYDDLEFLENLGLIEGQVTAEATEAEAAEIDLLNFEDLIGGDSSSRRQDPSDRLGSSDTYEERRFRLTKTGLEKVQQLIDGQKLVPVIKSVANIKKKYGGYSLSDLLYYVYKQYPDMTTESEIKDQVLRKHRRA